MNKIKVKYSIWTIIIIFFSVILYSLFKLNSDQHKSPHSGSLETSESSNSTIRDRDTIIEEFLKRGREDGLIEDFQQGSIPEDYTLYYSNTDDVIDFNIMKEITIDETSGPPPNEMRIGKIITFSHLSDMKQTIENMSNMEYVDLIGIDTNYVNPVFIPIESINTLIQINKNVPVSYIDKYEKILSDILS